MSSRTGIRMSADHVLSYALDLWSLMTSYIQAWDQRFSQAGEWGEEIAPEFERILSDTEAAVHRAKLALLDLMKNRSSLKGRTSMDPRMETVTKILDDSMVLMMRMSAWQAALTLSPDNPKSPELEAALKHAEQAITTCAGSIRSIADDQASATFAALCVIRSATEHITLEEAERRERARWE